jgi:hypothetical protein
MAMCLKTNKGRGFYGSVDAWPEHVDEVSPDWAGLCTNVERVKSFAPTVYHYVADVLVGPRNADTKPRI